MYIQLYMYVNHNFLFCNIPSSTCSYALEAHCCVNVWTEVNYTGKIHNRKSKKNGCFDLEGLRQLRRHPRHRHPRHPQSPRLTKTFEVETSRVFYSSYYIFCSYNWLPFIHLVTHQIPLLVQWITSSLCSGNACQQWTCLFQWWK